MPVWLVPKKIKKHGLKEHGEPSQIIQIWIEFLFEHYNKLKNHRDKFPRLLISIWNVLSPICPWLRFEVKKSSSWAEVLLVEDSPEIIVNIAFPFKQHYTTLLSDKQIEIPSNLTVSEFKSGKYLTFKGIVTKTELIELLIQIFSKAYGCSQDSIIIATLTD